MLLVEVQSDFCVCLAHFGYLYADYRLGDVLDLSPVPVASLTSGYYPKRDPLRLKVELARAFAPGNPGARERQSKQKDAPSSVKRISFNT